MKTSESILKISPAIVAAQAAIKTVTKEGVNTFFKKADGTGAPYATLDSIIEACKEPLAENKLAVIQFPTTVNEKYIVRTRVQHDSGEYFEEDTPLLLGKQDMQGFGAAITYAKRFALGSFFNIATEVDDDGNASQKPKPDDKKQASASPVQKPQGKPENKAPTKPKTLKEVLDQGSLMKMPNPAELIIDFGKKFIGKKLGDLSVKEIEDNIDYWDKQDLATVPNNIVKFLVNANEYLILKGAYPPKGT